MRASENNNHFSHTIGELLAPFEDALGRKLKLIIHVGTPKTGSTSMQSYLEKKQSKLRRKGILYPHNLDNITNSNAPKHQWFDKNMAAAHTTHFLENFKNIVAQVNENTHTIILSSEGIYNYWWDFPVESKSILKELSGLFDISIWVWFREPLAFIESYYKQCIRNPSVEGNPCYGKDLSFADMLDIDWFAQHLDYDSFIEECQSIFGKDSVVVYSYDDDVVQQLMQLLEMATPHDNPTARYNSSLGGAAVSILRQINQLNIKPKDKERLMPHLRGMNEVLNGYNSDALIDEVSKKRVLALAKSDNVLLSKQL